MSSNKIVNLLVIAFLVYCAFSELHKKTGSYIPQIPIESKLLATADGDSIVAKLVTMITKPYDIKNECGIGKEAFLSQPKISHAFKIFITNLGEKPILCSDQVKLRYKIYKLDGELLFHSKPKIINFGDLNVPYVFHKAIIHSNHQSALTILSPSRYLSHNILLEKMDSILGDHLSLPANEMVMIDLSLD